jgi:tryptophanyl-tRNA synthetase
MAKRSLTGVKSTGQPHLGNLLGAIRPALDLVDTHESFYFIASYHALTTVHDRQAMRESVLDVAATWLACGLDPNRTTLWAQHDVPEVCELAWVLSCVASKSSLDKAHAFKDAVGKGFDPTVGLFSYPLLMAADILAFDADVVPVGRDQKQHIEMCRDLAIRFNHTFGDTLRIPEPYILDNVATVPGIDGQKMSKSYDNHIALFLTEKQLRKRIMSIVTDSLALEDVKDPDTCNVFALYRLFASTAETSALAERYRAGGMGYGHAKQELFEVVDRQLAEPRARYAELRADPARIQGLLTAGAAQARPVAQATLRRVRDAIGL